MKIISGGQTGVDRAALDWAIANNVPHAGYCPRGQHVADELLRAQYNLIQIGSEQRITGTKLNIYNSDGTIIVYRGKLEGDASTIYHTAKRLSKPVKAIEITKPTQKVILHARGWILCSNITVIHLTGPSESQDLGIYTQATRFISGLLGQHKVLDAS